MEYNFNKNWILTDSKGGSRKVDLPYDAMIREKRKDDCINGINSGYFPGGRYTYSKEFEVAEDEMQKVIIVHFECVYQNCTVTVNDREVARHRYGYFQDMIIRGKPVLDTIRELYKDTHITDYMEKA